MRRRSVPGTSPRNRAARHGSKDAARMNFGHRKDRTMTSIHPYAILATLAWTVMALNIQAARAEAPPANAGNDYSQRHELTGTDLEIFFDALVPTQLFRDHIAGAVAVVVKDGKV